MRLAGFSANPEKKWRGTTIRVPGVRVADDLLDRKFAAGAPNRVWVADITYLRTWQFGSWRDGRRATRTPRDRRGS